MLAALLLTVALAAAPAPYDARCVAVHDGDTITVHYLGVDRHIRLAEIDAPELKQPHGPQSRDALAREVLNQTVTIEPVTVDRYGRTVAQVFRPRPAGRIWINAQQLRDGHAWHYREYSKNQALADLETKARRARLGLWSANQPQPPWDYRKQSKTKPNGTHAKAQRREEREATLVLPALFFAPWRLGVRSFSLHGGSTCPPRFTFCRA